MTCNRLADFISDFSFSAWILLVRLRQQEWQLACKKYQLQQIHKGSLHRPCLIRINSGKKQAG